MGPDDVVGVGNSRLGIPAGLRLKAGWVRPGLLREALEPHEVVAPMFLRHAGVPHPAPVSKPKMVVGTRLILFRHTGVAFEAPSSIYGHSAAAMVQCKCGVFVRHKKHIRQQVMFSNSYCLKELIKPQFFCTKPGHGEGRKAEANPH